MSDTKPILNSTRSISGPTELWADIEREQIHLRRTFSSFIVELIQLGWSDWQMKEKKHD